MQWETAPELLHEMVNQSLSITQVANLSADICSCEKGNNGSQPSDCCRGCLCARGVHCPAEMEKANVVASAISYNTAAKACDEARHITRAAR